MKDNNSECDIVSDGKGHFFCRNCGKEYIAFSAAMLYATVYGQFCEEYYVKSGVVEFQPFVQWLGRNLDDEQIDRTFHYLKKMRLVSKSADGKYLKHGVGQDAENEHRKALWRARVDTMKMPEGDEKR